MPKKEEKPVKSFLAVECDKVGEIAIQYGFTVINPPSISTSNISDSKQFKEYDYFADAEEKVTLTKWYVDQNMMQGTQPQMFFYKRPLSGGSLRKKPTEESYGLEIMGSSRTESEAILLKASLAILEELGFKNLCVNINSIGDRESINKFERELTSYCRKHIQEIPVKLRDSFKKNHYSIYNKFEGEDVAEFQNNLPQTVGALSDQSRCHFKEVLEYLESFGIMYKIKPNLFSNKLFASQTVFEVCEMKDNGEEGARIACGYRYNYLAKKIGAKKEVPSIGMVITVKKALVPQKKILIKNIKKPKFYLVQLGSTAKLKALNVVEMLRSQRIPVYHSLVKDKITGQLSGAEYYQASHVLIIGQKEAIENSIVVRHVLTREQETVELEKLVDFLRKI